MAARTVSVGCSVGLAVAAGCADLANLGPDYQLASAGGAGGQAPTCPPAVLPTHEPPRPTPGTPGESLDLFFALDRVDLGETSEGTCADRPIPGLDLDNVVSTTEAPACQPTEDDEGLDQNPCDGPGGIDNQNAILASFFGGSTALGTPEATAAAAAGLWSIVFRISDFNGGLEDDAVTVAAFPSTGTDAPPRWDGTDDFRVFDTAVAGSIDSPRYVSSGAYVTCGMLVASFDRYPFAMANGPTHIQQTLDDFRILARIVAADDGRFSLDGVLAGIWPLETLFEDVDTVRAVYGVPLCADDPGYSYVQNLVCALPDITAAPSSATTTCDAFSVGIGFGARTVTRPTTIVPAPEFPRICAPGALPSENRCP